MVEQPPFISEEPMDSPRAAIRVMKEFFGSDGQGIVLYCEPAGRSAADQYEYCIGWSA